jgi:hypothetical protein
LNVTLDAAKRECADDAFKRAVLEGESLAAKHSLVNLNACRLDPFSCPSVHPDIWFNGRDFANVGWVAGQVQAGAKAKFQNVAAAVGEQITAILCHDGSIQTEIAETWDDHLRIEAHVASLSAVTGRKVGWTPPGIEFQPWRKRMVVEPFYLHSEAAAPVCTGRSSIE